MDKLDFMNAVKAVLEETDGQSLRTRGEEMKKIIDYMVNAEINYEKAGLR